MAHPLDEYHAASGTLDPVWTIEIQTVVRFVDRLLDAVVQVHPLRYGIYERNASVSAVGLETARPMPGSTTETHLDGFVVGATETYPMVEVKISIERDPTVLASVMDALLAAHHYEQPVIFVREDWVSRSAYEPTRANPNRWWNDGLGLPDKVGDIAEFYDER